MLELKPGWLKYRFSHFSANSNIIIFNHYSTGADVRIYIGGGGGGGLKKGGVGPSLKGSGA